MYDYKEGKKRINEILNSSVPVENKTHIPSDATFTYENGIKSWVGSLFVDIRKSTELFNDNDDITIAKMIRSFSSEIVEILNSSSIIKEVISISPLNTDLWRIVYPFSSFNCQTLYSGFEKYSLILSVFLFWI